MSFREYASSVEFFLSYQPTSQIGVEVMERLRSVEIKSLVALRTWLRQRYPDWSSELDWRYDNKSRISRFDRVWANYLRWSELPREDIASFALAAYEPDAELPKARRTFTKQELEQAKAWRIAHLQCGFYVCRDDPEEKEKEDGRRRE